MGMKFDSEDENSIHDASDLFSQRRLHGIIYFLFVFPSSQKTRNGIFPLAFQSLQTQQTKKLKDCSHFQISKIIFCERFYVKDLTSHGFFFFFEQKLKTKAKRDVRKDFTVPRLHLSEILCGSCGCSPCCHFQAVFFGRF